MSYTPPPPPPPPESGQGAYGAPQRTSTMSLTSLILGIVSVPACGCFIFSIAAIVLGILGRREVVQSGGQLKGEGMAKAGLILGIVSLVLAVVVNILILADVIQYDYNFSTDTNA